MLFAAQCKTYWYKSKFGIILKAMDDEYVYLSGINIIVSVTFFNTLEFSWCHGLILTFCLQSGNVCIVWLYPFHLILNLQYLANPSKMVEFILCSIRRPLRLHHGGDVVRDTSVFNTITTLKYCIYKRLF
jgi:hypothetical protein